MTPQLKQLAQKYEALSLRERLLVAFMCAAFIIIGWLELFWDNKSQQLSKFKNELTTIQSQMTAAQQQLTTMKSASRVDADAAVKAQLAELQQQQQRLDAQLKKKMHALIAPTEMARVLEAVLTRQTTLEIQRIQNLSTRPLIPLGEGENKSEVGVYKHGLQIEFSGSYLATLAYLQELKALPWEFYWDELELEVLEYPISRITITVHTLSFREGWLGV